MVLNALMTIILLSGIAIIAYGPWQTFCTDAARQDLFEIRDKIFDLAHEGHLSFDSSQYRTIRTSIEQNIRYAHMLTVWRFFVILAFLKKRKQLSQKSEMLIAIESIKDDKVRNEVLNLWLRTTQTNIKMMVAKAPVFIVLMLAWLLAKKLIDAFDGAKGHFSFARNKIAEITNAAGEAIQIEAENVCTAQ